MNRTFRISGQHLKIEVEEENGDITRHALSRGALVVHQGQGYRLDDAGRSQEPKMAPSLEAIVLTQMQELRDQNAKLYAELKDVYRRFEAQGQEIAALSSSTSRVKREIGELKRRADNQSTALGNLSDRLDKRCASLEMNVADHEKLIGELITRSSPKRSGPLSSSRHCRVRAHNEDERARHRARER